jgi:hypothetical protein
MVAMQSGQVPGSNSHLFLMTMPGGVPLVLLELEISYISTRFFELWEQNTIVVSIIMNNMSCNEMDIFIDMFIYMYEFSFKVGSDIPSK